MSKSVELELSVTAEGGSVFSFSTRFEEAELPIAQFESIYNDAAAMVRDALVSTEAEIDGRLDPKSSFVKASRDEDEIKNRQNQIKAIRENPGEAASQINRLTRDRTKLQEQLGEARQELQAAAIPRQKLEDLYARTKARGLAPFALPLDVMQSDLQIERMHKALMESLAREDALRDRLIAAGLATDEEIAEWSKKD